MPRIDILGAIFMSKPTTWLGLQKTAGNSFCFPCQHTSFSISLPIQPQHHNNNYGVYHHGSSTLQHRNPTIHPSPWLETHAPPFRTTHAHLLLPTLPRRPRPKTHLPPFLLHGIHRCASESGLASRALRTQTRVSNGEMLISHGRVLLQLAHPPYHGPTQTAS